MGQLQPLVPHGSSGGLGQQRLVGRKARLALGLARPGGETNPLELPLEGATAGRVGLLLLGEAGLLLLEPRRVVALPRQSRPSVELEDPARHVVEEVPVVGDRHDRSLVLVQKPLEPGHRLGVEVVGGLVQQEEIGPAEQQAAEGDPAPLAARERVHAGIAGREPEGVHGDLEGAVQLPGSDGLDAVLDLALLGQEAVHLVGARRSQLFADLVEAPEQRRGLAHTLGHVSEDVAGRIEGRFLGEMTDREAGGEPGLPGVPIVLAGHDPQQGGLAGAVGADDADLGSRVEGKVDPLQHLAVGRVENDGGHASRR